MDFYERITALIKEKGLSQGKLESELGLSNGSVSKWKKSIPKTQTIILLANYFNVDEKYLLTGEHNYSAEIAREDVKLSEMSKRIKSYALKLAELPKDKQELVINLINVLSKGDE